MFDIHAKELIVGEIFVRVYNEQPTFQLEVGIFCIRKTCPCDIHPLTPHLYIVKLGFTGVFIFFNFCSKT